MDLDELLARSLQVCVSLSQPLLSSQNSLMHNTSTSLLTHPHLLLQVEQAQQQQQQLNDQQRQVLGVIQQNQFKAQSVEDPRLFAQARSLMPLDAWRQQAREQVELNQQLQPAGGGGGGAATTTAAVDDLVVKSMLQWFKRDFFSWVGYSMQAMCPCKPSPDSGTAPHALFIHASI